MIINPQLKNPKFYLMILMDIFIFIVALCLSYLIRFEFSFDHIVIGQIYGLLLWMVPLKFIIFLSVRPLQRYVALHQRAGFLAFSPGLSLIDGAHHGDYPGRQRV